ncbi:hypothetical protein PMZ80_010534 [Knufia obscura]|uniref:trans-L-3-hydroxyproline dehydratase n=2 Tax=Knufia TaxID=430999 RepID=A0AAN8EQQ5_9EURO|nr:hypothetical protein PMZ80_010534 [Knufia obscura]KAK5950113.1 hypothetical protein OHC33_008828 [Knufia fluminis]
MDVIKDLSGSEHEPITCIDMHTCGEPTRIIIKGYPSLTGSLLEQRSQAKSQYDHIRRRLMLEPRGHFDMYGAILRQETELTKSGQADIGVLFTTNDGYSTMCGHATIALGRFLVDTHDLEMFPNRKKLQLDSEKGTTFVRLHAPCGLVEVTVPTKEDGMKSDPSRPVTFTSVDCFATGLNITIRLPNNPVWPSDFSIVADFSYGGAFYCFVNVRQLPFLNSLSKFDMDVANQFTKALKATINNDLELSHVFRHPKENDLSFLYSVILVDTDLGVPLPGSQGAESGLCFFADQQVDRSPTGSAVSARLALAYAHKKLKTGNSWTYHSLVSLKRNDRAAFMGTVLEEVKIDIPMQYPCVKTQIEGHASYTGYHTFVVETNDLLGNDGFTMKGLAE